MKKNILSFLIDCVSERQAVDAVCEWVKKRKKSYVCVASLHLLTEGINNIQIEESIRSAGLVVPDGMPLVWMLQWKGCARVERVYGPDLMLRLCEEAQRRKWRVFFLGGHSGQSRKLATKLLQKMPSLSVAGAIDTPRRPLGVQENNHIVASINASKVDIVFVGIGCPEQETWMLTMRTLLDPSVLVGVGAAFNFLTGEVRQAPRWAQRMGFEWLFRISQEPRRLLPRYINIIWECSRFGLKKRHT